MVMVHCVWRSSFCFFKQNTAYEMRISDWSSDVCSSDLAFDIADEVAAARSQRRIARAQEDFPAEFGRQRRIAFFAELQDMAVQVPDPRIGGVGEDWKRGG